MNFLVLILTFSMSGIVYTCVGITVMFTFEMLRNIKKVSKRLLLLVIAEFVVIVLVLCTENPISSRLLLIVIGKDGSANYRWEKSINAFGIIMKNTHFWGMGLGNMSTQKGLSFLHSIGMSNVFANSFLYFMAENVFGGFYILFI